MFEIIPENIRSVMLDYDFIKQYLNGRMSREAFRENLKVYAKEINSRGVHKDYLNNLYNADDEHEFNRKASHSRFVRFAKKLGLDIATKDDKIKWMRTMSSEKFLDALSVSSGLLRNVFHFLKWADREEDKIIVNNLNFGTDIEPPDNSNIEFQKFFELMKKNISTKNIDLWALKLFFAIIYAHMFENGNGRLARNAYFMLKSNGLLDEKKSSKRTNEIMNVCRLLNITSIGMLMRKEGLIFKYINDYDADEEWDEKEENYSGGLVRQLKYIAAKRILGRHNEYKGEKLLGLKNWSKERIEEYNLEYQKIRVEWYWECLRLAEEYNKNFSEILDKIILN